MRKILFSILFLSISFFGYNECSIDYIKKFAPIAVYEMKYYGIPASIKLSQSIIESSCGDSILAKEANNYFGIKCGKCWNGKTFSHDDDMKNECFRKYDTSWHSFRDHSEFLKKSRYANLFCLSRYDYKSWAKGLKKYGYATDKNYADKLISKIEEYELWKFDKFNYNDMLNFELKKILNDIIKYKINKNIMDNKMNFFN